MLITDIAESERERVKVNKKGEVLCLFCEKNLANISEYGMLRKCDKCASIKDYNVMISIDEPGGRRYY